MRLLGLLILVGALGLPSLAHGEETTKSALTAAESGRLSRHETVTREQTLEYGDHHYVGGLTYTMLEASPAEVAAVLEDVDSLKRVLPRTKHARLVGTQSGDQLLEITSGNGVMEAAYTLRVRRGKQGVRFWLDPSRPHGIDDAWGFFRYETVVGPAGDERVLLTYGILVDVGPGIVRELFEERVRSALLSVPQLVRRQVAERSARWARRPDLPIADPAALGSAF
jgi:hypothetical protein